MVEGEDDGSDEGVVTEVEAISDDPMTESEGSDGNVIGAEESVGDAEGVSEVAAELNTGEVGEDIAALLVTGPVPLGTICRYCCMMSTFVPNTIDRAANRRTINKDGLEGCFVIARSRKRSK